MAKAGKQKAERLGIQSVEVGINVLRVVGAAPQPLSLVDIAKAAGLSPSLTHRYLASLERTDLVERSSGSGRYSLGPECRRLGLSALVQVDSMRIVTEAMTALRDRLDQTVLFCTWTPSGVTIIHWLSGSPTIPVTFKLGSVLPLAHSATGRIFLAFMPRLLTDETLERERNLAQENGADANGSVGRKLLDDIRTMYLSASDDEIIPGIRVLSVPVFDFNSDLFGAFTILAPRRNLLGDALYGAVIDTAAAAGSLSAQLGAPESTVKRLGDGSPDVVAARRAFLLRQLRPAAGGASPPGASS